MNREILAPGIFVYNVSEKINNLFVNQIEDAIGDKLKPATVVNVDDLYQAQLMKQYRSCFDWILPDHLLELPEDNKESLLLKSFKDIAEECIQDFRGYFSTEEVIGGGWIILKYGYEDKFDWHVDAGNRYPRNISATIYFNDNYEGGEIEFKHFNISYKPKAGDIMVFCSDYPYMHRVTPVKSGLRYAAVNWYRYKTRPLEYTGE